MPLLHHTYGKGRVRVMRVYREGPYNEVRSMVSERGPTHSKARRACNTLLVVIAA